jgi:hypothetical protein
MSDALLTEISGKLTQILGALNSGAGKPVVPSRVLPTEKPAAPNKTPAAPPAAPKAAAPGTAAPKPAPPKAAGAAPAAAAKAPGGKHTAEEVRDAIKKVATNPSLGKQTALNILDENAGVQNVSAVKPENFDAVFEACEVELRGVANARLMAAAPAAEEDDPTA